MRDRRLVFPAISDLVTVYCPNRPRSSVHGNFLQQCNQLMTVVSKL